RTTLEEENQRLRALLGLRERLPSGWLPAEVLRPGTQGSESIFILDLDEGDRIRERAAVVTREGLAGVVRERRGRQAVGMDWTHPEFRASAMSEDGLTFGVVESVRGAFREEDRLVLRGTPYNTLLEPGTLIVTSGLGAAFPRGIPIGRIGPVRAAEGGWRRSYWMTPVVEPGAITLVLVESEATGGRNETPGETPDERVADTAPPLDSAGNGGSPPSEEDRLRDASGGWEEETPSRDGTPRR
ncbi:MAG: rod shape-determining protein MreC, partial [Longimicrobiales bacterium]|nr:rod shape-determining protein MreC [Longimicrobiales bacterium]